jgi:uncharacterized protein
MVTVVDQFVLKIHGRCDLACDHCYIYEHPDQSWRAKPREMSPEVVARVAERITEHAAAHRLSAVQVVLHGGEPLLVGVPGLRQIIETLRIRVESTARLRLSIQTNGVRLSEEFCRLFDELGVRVGISLDGDPSANDRHRRFSNGHSSHPIVIRALALLRRPEFRHLYGGLLCTIDIRNDPIAVYEALLEQEPPHLDFLFPHATWENPPLRHGETPAPYADWLGQIHERWSGDGRPIPIRLFDALTAASMGRPSGSESVGLGPVNLAVVDTDGSWEQVDSLKAAYDGAPRTGMTVFDHSVDGLTEHPGMAARRGGLSALCAICRECPIVRTCGGGLYTHRYRVDTGFDNPSVYCADIKALVHRTVKRRVSHPLTEGDTRKQLHMSGDAFDALARGAGTVEGVQALLDTQLTLTRILLSQTAPPVSRSPFGEAAIAGWDLLTDLEISHSDDVAWVLAHPYIQTWAMRCLGPENEADLGRDRAQLAGIAAAAALRAGVPVRLPIPVRDGWIHLPGEGAWRHPEDELTTIASLDGTPGERDGWAEVRRLAGPVLPVTIEDLDPYRDCHGGSPFDRLTLTKSATWREALLRAGEELSRLVPDHAAVLRHGLRSVVPLRGWAGPSRRHGLGGVGLGPTDDLSELLLREFQSTKLAALLDIFTLLEPGSSLLPVPRLANPGLAKEVFQDVYVGLAHTELLLARSTTCGHSSEAAARYMRVRERVDTMLDALMAADVLTPAGHRFATGMRTTIDQWRGLP